MSQHDLTIDNQGFPAFRADLNNALQALGSTQSGTSAPSPTFANQLWYDTTNNQLKIRNEDNDAWITLLTLDQTGDVTSGVGAKTLPAGDIVGTSDSQTLTNKTINASQLVNASVTPEKLSTQAQYTAFKNRIINGAMVIDQRNAGASVTPADGAYTLDRWVYLADQASKCTIQQNAGSVTPPAGFSNYLGVTSTAATTITTSQQFSIIQRVEGFNMLGLNWGSANAQTVTLSFWVRSSLTGTFGGVLRNDAGDYNYPFSYTISSANTWEQKSVTITGATTGTWTINNGRCLQIAFSLGAGATLSGTAGAWTSSNFWSVTGATQVLATNGATFYITGVQLEVGSTATSFDYRPYGTELALCQRYYWQMVSGDQNNIANGTYYNSTTFICSIQYPVTMRGTPTLSYVTGTSYYAIYGNNASDPIDGMYLGATNATSTNLESGGQGASGTQGYGGQLRSNNASAKLAFTAEL